MINCLITGIAGFIGSHLAESLLNMEGYKVYGIDDLSTGSLDNLKHLENNSRLDVNINSILNFNALNSLVNECDVVFHLAAAVGVEYIVKNSLQTLLTNVRGTENVLEAASYKKRKVIVASTSEVYGKSTENVFSEDSDRLLGSTEKSRWSYSCTKALDEFLAFAYHKEKRLPMTIVRFFNIIGERQTGKYGMVVPRFIKAALQNKSLYIYGDGLQTRCFAYVKDIIKGLEKLMHIGHTNGQIYNLGSQEEISIKSLAEKIILKTTSSSKIIYKDFSQVFGYNFEDMLRRKPDLTKAKTHLDYQPETNLDTTLSKIIRYFKEKEDDL